jgi:hypothetical protein
MPAIQSLISSQFSRYDWTPSTVIPGVEGVGREVVMLPATKDICSDGVEVVTAVLVTVVKMVTKTRGCDRPEDMKVIWV